MTSLETGIGASAIRPSSLSDDDNCDLAYKQHVLSLGWWAFVVAYRVY